MVLNRIYSPNNLKNVCSMRIQETVARIIQLHISFEDRI